MRIRLLFIVLMVVFLLSACKPGTEDNGGNNGGNNGGTTPPGDTVNWQELGPSPIGGSRYTGRVSAIGVSSGNSNLYYLAGADGGVWKSEDEGASWNPLTDHLPTTAMGALAVDPHNDQIVYAGSGEANFANHSRYGMGLYKTEDGGSNWVVLAAEFFSGRCFSRLRIDPDNTATIYAAITHAGGLPSFDFNIAAARGHTGAMKALGVWKSMDSGTSWTQLDNGIPTDLSASDLLMDAGDSSILYASVNHIFGDSRNGIYKSTDSGNSWTKLSGGLPTAFVGRSSLATSAANPNRIYASIVQAADEEGRNSRTLGVYRSDDGGNTWITKHPGSIHASYGFYLNTIAASPTDPDTVFVGGLTLHRSSDGGDTWVDVTGIQHVDFHALVFDAVGRLLSGNDGGIYRSDDLGMTWANLNNGLGIVQFYAGFSIDPDNPNTIYAGSQDNGTLKRTGTDKSSWTRILGGDGGCTGILPNDSSVVFAEYQGSGNIFKSINYGSGLYNSGSGIDVTDPNSFEAPFNMDKLNPGHIYYATNRIYRSTDEGVNWEAISGDLTAGSGAAVRGFSLAPSDSSVIYAGTNDGRILVSVNGGYDWDLRKTGVQGWPRIVRQWAIHNTDPANAYLAVSYFGVDQVLMTTNMGVSWQSLDNNLPDIPVNTICLDSGTGYIYIGTDAGVYRSAGGSSGWELHGQGLPNCAVNDIKLDIQNNRLVVATQGRGMWSIGINR